MRLILFALFVLGALALAVVLLAWLAERRLDETAEAHSFSDVARLPAADVALVLGTAPIGPEGGPNVYFVHRLDAAAALWKAGKVKYFIVSGSTDEPAAMRAGLVERGVPAAAIYDDPAGYRTWDSVLRARDVYGQKRLVIVSQRFHLSRALFLARHAGIEAWGFEARDVDSALQHLHRAAALPVGVARLPRRLDRRAGARRRCAGEDRDRPAAMKRHSVRVAVWSAVAFVATIIVISLVAAMANQVMASWGKVYATGNMARLPQVDVGAGPGHAAVRSAGPAQSLAERPPGRGRRAVAGRQGQVPDRERQPRERQLRRADRDARRAGRARRAGQRDLPRLRGLSHRDLDRPGA